MKILFSLVCILIAYGSLYPFDFLPPAGILSSHTLSDLLAFEITSRGDVLGNIVLFVPFGLLGVLAFQRTRIEKTALFLLFAGGLSLSMALQVGQLLLPSRNPSSFDIVLNVIGMAAGMWLGATRAIRRFVLGLRAASPTGVPLLLVGAWALSQLLPLVPTLDFAEVKGALKPLVLQPDLLAPELLLFFAAWLAILYILSSSSAWKRSTSLLPLLPLSTLAVQPFLVGGRLTLGEVAGSAAAILAWYVAKSRFQPLAIALVLLGAIMASNLLPWETAPWPRTFAWIPFSGFLEGDMLTNSIALLHKLALYGSALWLLHIGGVLWSGATLLLVIVLGTQEALQLLSAHGTPEITDLLLALGIGVGLARLDGSAAAKQLAGAGGASNSSREPPLGVDPKKARPEAGGTPAATVAPADKHLAGLDGLRAFAALSVFGVHFNQMAGLEGHVGPFDIDRWLANGNTGVALFFVLSGFLLSMPFWRQGLAGGPSIDVKQYFLRRLVRILPAYYLCLFGLLAIKWAAGREPSINNMFSHVVFLYNLNDWNILAINEPFWTLAVEMQFYLLLPLLMLTVRGLRPGLAFALILTLAAGAYLLNHGLVSYLMERAQWPIQTTLLWPFSLYISGPSSFVLTYSTLAHITFFLIGMATSLVFVRTAEGRASAARHGPPWGMEVAFWCAAVLILVILATPLDDLLQVPNGRYNWPFVPLLIAAMIFVTPHTTVAKGILEWGPVRWLGVISFGIYIFHYPIQKLVVRLFDRIDLSAAELWWLFGLVSLAVTLTVATFSYRLVENPAMQWARSRGRRSIRDGAAGTEWGRPIARGRRNNRHRGVWTYLDVPFHDDQLRALRQIADTRGLSISGAARILLTNFMAEHRDWTGLHEEYRGDARTGDGGREEICRVNIRKEQLAFLEQVAKIIGGNAEDAFALIVPRVDHTAASPTTRDEDKDPAGKQ